MKTLSYLIIVTLFGFISMITTADSVHEFKANNIDGKETALNQFQGQVLLIVNTASECGNTPQYEGLQNVYQKYKDKGLAVLGFPANNFGGQEPGTDEEIKQFCKVNYDVTFPMFSKISVKGEDMHPLFRYLTTAENPDFTGEIKWNFEKFLVDRDGELVHRFRTKVEPESDEIINAIEKVLNS